MKKAVVLLAILSVALAAALCMSRQNAGNQIQRTAADLASFSNRLADAEMKLNHQERMNLSLGSNVSNRTDELARSASDLAKLRNSLAQSQAETRAIQAQLQSTLSQVQVVQSQVSDLSNRIQELTAESRRKDGETALAQAQLAGEEAKRQAMAHQLSELQQDNDKMARQLRDPELLRAQIVALKKQQAAVAESKRTASSRPDYRLDLELLPNGNVQFVSPAISETPPTSNPSPKSEL
jgi:chromosome segregation ATPase